MRGKWPDSKLVKRQLERVLRTTSSASRNMTMLTKLIDKIDARSD